MPRHRRRRAARPAPPSAPTLGRMGGSTTGNGAQVNSRIAGKAGLSIAGAGDAGRRHARWPRRKATKGDMNLIKVEQDTPRGPFVRDARKVPQPEKKKQGGEKTDCLLPFDFESRNKLVGVFRT